jgi:glycosyltransferase involved in cell wall biosynthesis
MPTYNHVNFVRLALTGALEQDYPNLQVVACDDGSSDGTVEILKEYAGKYGDRLTTIIGEPHLGITRNSNRTLAASRGKYIALYAGDDIYLPGKITRQVEWMEADERRVLCGHDVEIFNSDTNRSLGLWSDRFPLKDGKGAETVIRNGYVFPGPSIMVRRSALPIGGYDERLPIMSDWKLWIDCLSDNGIFGYINGVYSRYRRHDGNVTSGLPQQCFEDELTTLALVEAAYPRFIGACRHHRARCFQAKGMRHLRKGEKVEARAYLASAVYQNAFAAWKSIPGIPLTFLSRGALKMVLPLLDSANRALIGRHPLVN